MEESVLMERVTVLIRTLDMPALKNYVRLSRHTVCAEDCMRFCVRVKCLNQTMSSIQ